jgi:hypothetical protein
MHGLSSRPRVDWGRTSSRPSSPSFRATRPKRGRPDPVEEHMIYPEAVKLFFEGRLEIKGRRVAIL